MPTCRLACGQHAQCIRVRMHNLQSITETLDMSTVLADLPPERNGSSQLEFRRSHMQEHNLPSDLSFSTLWYRRSRYVFPSYNQLVGLMFLYNFIRGSNVMTCWPRVQHDYWSCTLRVRALPLKKTCYTVSCAKKKKTERKS
jgi:hypothetical protein